MELLIPGIYRGIEYVQSVIWGAVMLSLTLKPKKNRRISVLQWLFVTVCAFLIGALISISVTKMGGMAMAAAQNAERMWQIQMYYTAISIMNILDESIAAIVICIAAIWIYEEERNIKIFVPVLFMLVFASAYYVFDQIAYIFFSPGKDEELLLRISPNYPIRCFIDWGILFLLCLLYHFLLKERLIHILDIAREQICKIVVVPAISYILYMIVKSTLATYGLTLLSIDAGSFLVALITIGSLLAIYLLMFWAIFRAILAIAGSAKVKAELDVASKIQLSALPTSFEIGKEKGIDIFASMHPAKEVGGDFYDFFFVDEDHLAVLIADVSGKGVPAALFMMSGRALIRNQLLLGLEPAEILKRSNNELAENNKEGMFITAFLGILDRKTGHFSYSNAGHNVPFLCRKDGTVEAVPMHHGFVLAGMKNVRYRTQESTLLPGDKLILYTDGVTEAANGAEQMYAEQRLVKVLEETVKEDARHTVQAISQSIDAFVNGDEQADDITILAVRWNEG